MNRFSRSKKKSLLKLLLYTGLFLAAFGYIVLCLSGKGLPCFWLERYGVVCPSCGATRALLSLFQLNIKAAVEYHPVFTLAVYPIAALIVLQDIAVSIFVLITEQERISFLDYLFGAK